MDRRDLTRRYRRYSEPYNARFCAGYACCSELARLDASIDLRLRAAARALQRPSGLYLAFGSASPRAWAWDEWSHAMVLIEQMLRDHPLSEQVREVFHQRQRAAIHGQIRGLLQ